MRARTCRTCRRGKVNPDSERCELCDASARPPGWVIVNADGQFWDGRRWRAEYPDAARYSGRPVLAELPDGAILVGNYGLDTERRQLTARSACPECGSPGPHDDNGGRGVDLTFLCGSCGHQFDAVLE